MHQNFKSCLLHIDEPLLEFRHNQSLEYPRDGLFLYGPVGDTNQLPSIHYGVIGTSTGVRHFFTWAKSMAKFIDIPQPRTGSRTIQPQHVPFPGFAQAFHTNWPIESSHIINDLDVNQIERTLRIGNRYEAIRKAVDIYAKPLIDANNRLESTPQLWFIVIPEIIYALGRPESKVIKKDRVPGEVSISLDSARKLLTHPTLFGDDEREAQIYQYETHFRRQFKARLLKERIVTQIVRETTLAPNHFRNNSGMPSRRIEDAATVAWKLGTGTYYKAGGKPWQLANVRSGVCYVGLAYKRSELVIKKKHEETERACCAAQMFLSDGEGVVFRGALGPWYQTNKKEFHLDHDAAKDLIQMVIGEYARQHDGPPSELFIHAKSAFTDDEWKGFTAGCAEETNLVGVQIYSAGDKLKLYRPGAYPVIRGTALQTGEHNAFLWTSGYVPRLDTYMGPETPNPIYVQIHRGECKLKTVLEDVLALTKINFNSCMYSDGLPVTIRFADAVGDILVSAQNDGEVSEPKLPFKYYI